MKILDTQSLPLPGIELLKFARFQDERGYFTETYRLGDFETVPFLAGLEWVQCNESHSSAGVLRGLHFQWNPFMGKLVRTIRGHMLDIVLDIRIGSPTQGKAIAIDLPASPEQDFGEWIWVPPGFAHGNYFSEETTIEYFCTGQYSPGCEAGISPLASDIDWSLCDPKLRAIIEEAAGASAVISSKDREGATMAEWLDDERSSNFRYGEC